MLESSIKEDWKPVLSDFEHSEAGKKIEQLLAKQKAEEEEKNTIRCPRCGSTQITTGQRGYSLFSGFLGSNKTVNRCANCGYSWKPGR